MHFSLLVAATFFLPLGWSQQIYDVWETTWDRSKTFQYSKVGPINFVTTGSAGEATIHLDDTSVFQQIHGFGGSLTDSAALILNNLKSKNSANYWTLLNKMFDPIDSNHDSAGLEFVRVNLGASDFAASVYSFDDVKGDESLAHFSVDNAPAYLFTVLQDIISVAPNVKVQLLPWSPPGWMKDSGTMNGGHLLDQFIDVYANYLLKSLQGFQAKGIPTFMMGIQNEPENNQPSYPSCVMPAATMAKIGSKLRKLMDSNGFKNVKLVGFEHNWSDLNKYSNQLIQESEAFDGFAAHCYAGEVSAQDRLHDTHPNSEIYFTECTGTVGSDYWSDIKWYMDNIAIGGMERWAQVGAMWNLALDSKGLPLLPGTKSCGNGCRAMVSVEPDGTFELNQEFFAFAQASVATRPKDENGPNGKRIGVNVTGSETGNLRVGAYVTGRNNQTDWLRYSLVVLNWKDNANGKFEPKDITASISFRGKQATHTFTTGVTTLTFYAPSAGAVSRRHAHRRRHAH